jgi:electron transfer flavoprotein alpha/beta subunit
MRLITQSAIGLAAGAADDYLIWRNVEAGATKQSVLIAALAVVGESALAGVGVGAQDIYFNSLGLAAAGLMGYYISQAVRKTYQQQGRSMIHKAFIA